MPEEDSFAVLVKIMQDYRMREMFKPSMAELGLCMYQLDTLVQEHIPDLYVHFQSQAYLEQVGFEIMDGFHHLPPPNTDNRTYSVSVIKFVQAPRLLSDLQWGVFKV